MQIWKKQYIRESILGTVLLGGGPRVPEFGFITQEATEEF